MEKKFNKILDLINKDKRYHVPGSEKYLSLKKKLRFYIKKQSKNKFQYQPIRNIFIKLPFYKMGNINSLNLFDLDELIIFSIYSKVISKDSNVADLGANIGLHSLVMSKLGAKVTAYEPDLDHVKQFKKNLILNKINNVKVHRKAVYNKKKIIKFTKVINNSTSSFIGDAKSPYGPIKITKVKTENFKNILKLNDILKIDVEGVEDKLLKSTTAKDWKNKFVILEIGNKKNAEIIFNHFKKMKIVQFLAQKKLWKKVNKLNEMPFSYKDGSVLICNKNFKV